MTYLPKKINSLSKIRRPNRKFFPKLINDLGLLLESREYLGWMGVLGIGLPWPLVLHVLPLILLSHFFNPFYRSFQFLPGLVTLSSLPIILYHHEQHEFIKQEIACLVGRRGTCTCKLGCTVHGWLRGVAERRKEGKEIEEEEEWKE